MDNQTTLLSLIPLFPLLGALIAYLAGRVNRDWSGWIATSACALSFAVVLKLFWGLGEGVSLEQNLFTWIAADDLAVDFMFRFDRLTAVMCLVVTGIGMLIHLYSTAYMHEEPSRPRFFAYLNLFMFSMLLLVLGGNLLVLFVGWEGVGLCSYLLIGFWFKNLAYAGAGKKAFVVNRIGDAGFLLAVFITYFKFGTLDFVELKEVLPAALERTPALAALLPVIATCLFIGATGKSAQIPFFVWLPDAMAGPTPVSALIHAATMVTAGVYLTARMHFVFDAAPDTMALMAIIAVATAFVAGTIALAQNDIKKVLAYSTVSQLGFMFMAAATGAYWVAIFHVVTHAFFKACLFLGAGSVIHGCHHEQDMRQMGGLAKLMPITAITYGISTLAIAGIYPFAGYHSKHAIMAALEHTHNPYLQPYASVFVTLATITAFITAFYMARSFALTFLGAYRGHAHPHESPLAMTLPLMVLAFLALAGGVYLNTALPHYLSSVLPVQEGHHASGILEDILHSWVGIAGVILGLLVFTRARSMAAATYQKSGPIGRMLSGKYYIDEIYGAIIVRPLERLANRLWKTVDQGMLDGMVNGTGKFVEANGEVVRTFQSGQINQYAFFMFVAAVFITVFYLVV